MSSRVSSSSISFSFFIHIFAVLMTSQLLAPKDAIAAADDGIGRNCGQEYYCGIPMCRVSPHTGIDYGECAGGTECVPSPDSDGTVCCTDGVCDDDDYPPPSSSSNSSDSSDSSASTSDSSASSDSSDSSANSSINNSITSGSSASSDASSNFSDSSASSDASSNSSASSSDDSSDSSSHSSASSASSNSSRSSSASSDSSSDASTSSTDSSTSGSSTSASTSSDGSTDSSAGSNGSNDSNGSNGSNGSDGSTGSNGSDGSEGSNGSDSPAPPPPPEPTLPPGCEKKIIINDKDKLGLGPKLLVRYAQKVLVKIRKTAKNPSMRIRMKESEKRTFVKLAKYVELAKVGLDQLPDVLIICSSDTYCSAVDNTAAINQHMDAIRRLWNQIVRTLNRATRLVYFPIEEARKRTRVFQKKGLRYEQDLLRVAEGLPKTYYQCE